MALTDTAIKALKPRGTRYLVTDGRGLCLEILPSGHLSWLYRYRFKGKPEKVAIGSYPEMSLKIARSERDRLATGLAQGQSPAQEKRLVKAALASRSTLREYTEVSGFDVRALAHTNRHSTAAVVAGIEDTAQRLSEFFVTFEGGVTFVKEKSGHVRVYLAREHSRGNFARHPRAPHEQLEYLQRPSLA
jgi:hypothetical protein